jgi:hypothetical protein
VGFQLQKNSDIFFDPRPQVQAKQTSKCCVNLLCEGKLEAAMEGMEGGIFILYSWSYMRALYICVRGIVKTTRNDVKKFCQVFYLIFIFGPFFSRFFEKLM